MVQAIAQPAPMAPEDHHEQAPTDPQDQAAEAAAKLWSYPVGCFVMSFGFLLPSLLIAFTLIGHSTDLSHVLLKHPLETLCEALFVVCAPCGNYLSWLTCCREDKGSLMKVTLINGAALGTALLACGMSAAVLASNASVSPLMVAVISFCSCLTSGYLACELRRLSETRLSRSRKLLYGACGALLAVGALGACEAKATFIRINEYLALAGNDQQQQEGLSRLRQLTNQPWLAWLNCQQDLRMQCASESCAGIAGLFIRMSPQRERELYFKVTGKPYGNVCTDSVYAMPDDYMRRNVVGEASPSLSLVRSAITGNLNSASLSGTVEWTMVLKNTSMSDEEARAEIGLPPQASISGLAMCSQGQQLKGAVAGFGGSYAWSQVNNSNPASVVDLGRGRVLLKCSSVPADGELKVKFAVTERGQAESLTEQSYALPRLIATNFSLEGRHQLRLHADRQLKLGLEQAKNAQMPDGTWLSECSISGQVRHGAPIVVQLSGNASDALVAVADHLSGSGGYLVQSLTPARRDVPDQVVIVLDGSSSVAADFPKIQHALAFMPKQVNASLILASAGNGLDPVPLKQALHDLNSSKFAGGQDNLEAVTHAAEIAGETSHGAVLWIHGPQPSFNQELYITAPYISKPRFFELALDNGFTDTNEFFRNHPEIGPFAALPRRGDVGKDLTACLSRWQPGSMQYEVSLAHMPNLPSGAQSLQGAAAEEITLLYGRENCYEMLRQGNVSRACSLASHLGIVTPVTAAGISATMVAQSAASDVNDPVRAAQLQGASNGTAGTTDHNDNWLAFLNPRAALQGTLSQSFSTVVSQLACLNAYSTTGSSIDGGYAGSNRYIQAPNLTGATNGTFGPQGIDATVITGVNTAGTVRVNNLANLESVLNIIANMTEILGLACGAILLGRGLVFWRGWMGLSPLRTAAAGCLLVSLGLITPGCINWLVASARDANLFS